MHSSFPFKSFQAGLGAIYFGEASWAKAECVNMLQTQHTCGATNLRKQQKDTKLQPWPISKPGLDFPARAAPDWTISSLQPLSTSRLLNEHSTLFY